ncbi:sulfite exporter TauE/SafE family protein [Perlabentimonas gracilis]|uniref:sulfite exporter TauE/SafE family protein n=1 Tax=Perlabentimonas gracilis TaxID=2715279 RepID=UPI001C637F28|nr:sulfite exporter TauE/SafE family protein [Perlabentimonas gracilis]
MDILLLAVIIFLLAAVMTTTGRGGGNFYVLALALSGIGMHQSATTGQFILVISSLTATLFFAKRRITDWKLIALIGTMTILSAFLGGFFSGNFDGKVLKIVFAVFITIASFLMLKPVKEKKNLNNRFCITLKSGENAYRINLLLTIPFVLVTGFISGMVGISGGFVPCAANGFGYWRANAHCRGYINRIGNVHCFGRIFRASYHWPF